MKKILQIAFLANLLFASLAFANDNSTAPDFVESEKITNIANFWQATNKSGIGPMLPQIPSWDNRGFLIASWSPAADYLNAPTFIIMHGGGGSGTMHFKIAQDIQEQYKANVLILDSFWSRGRKRNTAPDAREHTRVINATHRVYDLLAAGKWLQEKGIKSNNVFPIGESQGGMVVMRAFTEGTDFAVDIKKYFSKGIVLWPACHWFDADHTRAHPVGPYHSPVLIISGGRDYGSPIELCPTRAVKSAEHVHWPEATHAWMIATHGPWKTREDGNCDQYIENRGQRIPMCYSETRTKETFRKIQQFIQ